MRLFITIVTFFFICELKAVFIVQPISKSVCSGLNTSFSIKDTVSASKTYNWQRKISGKWINLSNTGVFNGANKDTLYINPAADSLNGSLFRCSISTVSGSKLISDSVVLTVFSNSVLASSITGTSTICRGKSTTISISGGTLGTGASWRWYTSTCGGTSAGSTNSISVSPVNTTTYFARAEGTCNTTSCVNITVTVQDTSTPATSITGTSTICRGKSTTINISGGSLGTGASWRWYTVSCGGSSIGSTTSISVSPVNTTTYFIRAEGTCNTTSCVNITVTVQDTSTPATSILGNSTICLGKNTILSVNGGSLGTAATWKWYADNCSGTSLATGNNLTISPISNRNYFVRAEGTCNNTICRSISITVRDTSIVANITGPKEICYTNNATLSVSGGKLGFNAKWNWFSGSCGSNFLDSSNSIVVSPASPGTYTYYLRARGLCNTTICKDYVLIVRDSAYRATSISGSNTVCRGNSTTLSVIGGSTGSGGAWRWYSSICGGNLIGSGNTISITPTNSTTYFVRAEGTCNITACALINITVRDTSVPTNSINGNGVICLGKNTTLSTIGGALGSGANWRWYANNCSGTSIGSGSTLTVSPATTTSYYVRAEGTCNNTSCRNFTVLVQDTSIPALTVNGPSNTCIGKSVTLTANGGYLGAGANWKWYSGSCEGNLNGIGNSINVAPSSTTNFFLKADGICNTTACKSFLLTIQDSSVKPLSIRGGNSLCKGASTTLEIIGGNLGTGANWKWYSTSCGNGLVGAGNTLTVTPLSTTTYYVNAEGNCNKTSCQTFTVKINNPPILLANADTVCYGTVARPSIAGAVSYEWKPSIGLDNPYTNKPYVTLNSAITKPTTYTYKVIGTDWNRCTDSTEVNILVNPLPLVEAGTNFGICPNKSIKLVGSGASKYSWYNPSGIIISDKDTVSLLPTLSSKYKIIGTDSKGCSNYDSILVTVYPKAMANAGKDDSICANNTYQLNGSGGQMYSWIGPNLNQNNIKNPEAKPSNNAIYILTVTDNNGCMDSDSVKLHVATPPKPTITGDFTVCKNASDVLYNTNPTANAFHWSIINGQIYGGQGTNKALTKWNSVDSTGFISITEALKYYPFCKTTETKQIKITGGTAPSPPQLVLKANKIESKILICPNCNFENYQWGSENKNNRIEIQSCKDILWCQFSNIDTANNFYWVKVGSDANCLTKAYFQNPILLKNTNIAKEEISVYPNPANNVINIKSNNFIKAVTIFNNIGEKIYSNHFNRDNLTETTIDVSQISRGFYFIKTETRAGASYESVILN